MENKNPIQVTDRLFLVLETLGELGPSTLSTLCQHMDLNKSTIHRLLSSLIHVGYVKQDIESGKYMLSYKILSLSTKLLSRMDLLDRLRPYFKQLSAQTGETVHFVQMEGCDAIYIHKEEAYQNSIRMASKVGSRIPLYCSGVGKAILADLSTDRAKEIWNNSEIKALTPFTIIDEEAFFTELDLVKSQGYSIDHEENELGVRCVAVSLPDYKGRPKYAVSVSGPVSRMDSYRIEEITAIILQMKKDIINELYLQD